VFYNFIFELKVVRYTFEFAKLKVKVVFALSFGLDKSLIFKLRMAYNIT
jgi:hypothetical protein